MVDKNIIESNRILTITAECFLNSVSIPGYDRIIVPASSFPGWLKSILSS